MFRDGVMLEFNRLREQLRPQKRDSLDVAIDELKQMRSHAQAIPVSAHTQARVCPSLTELRDLYLLKFTDKKKVGTLLKMTRGTELFLTFFRKKDFRLYEINRTMVTEWLEESRRTLAVQTLYNYVNSLSQIVQFAQDRYHDAPKENPFAGHKLNVREERISYSPFTEQELAKVFAAMQGDEEMQAVTLIGMYSGMRLNEICSLKTDNIRTIEGVLCFEVKEGKTKSAARIVPVHSQIKDLVKSLLQKPYDGFLFYHASITNRADGKRSTWHTQRFTRAKRKALGEKGTEYKVFHSLRGMFISQLDRQQIAEDRIALLAGHERGNTESFKTYSKNSASPVELSKYIELIKYDIGA